MMNNKNAISRLKHQKRMFAGFTFTEVIVASALLLLAIVPILTAVSGVHFNSSVVEKRTRSLSYAQSKIDDIKAQSIKNYSSVFDESSTSIEGSYLLSVSDTPVNASLRNIKVDVGYDDDGNNILDSDEILISLQTLIARR